MVVKKAAIKVRRLVRIPNGWQAQMREVLTEFLRLSSLNISVSRFRDAEPCRAVLQRSRCVRHTVCGALLRRGGSSCGADYTSLSRALIIFLSFQSLGQPRLDPVVRQN